MNKYLKVILAVLVVAAIIVGVLLLFEWMAEENKEESISVTITSIERAELRFGGGFFAADRAGNMPYIIAETESGEIIMGIIDISTLEKGDEVVIIEDTPHNQQEYMGYKWYKFVGYQ